MRGFIYGSRLQYITHSIKKIETYFLKAIATILNTRIFVEAVHSHSVWWANTSRRPLNGGSLRSLRLKLLLHDSFQPFTTKLKYKMK